MATAAVVVAAIVSAFAIRGQLHTDPDPAVTPPPIVSPTPTFSLGLPEYTDGVRVQAVLTPTPFGTPETTLTWTPLTSRQVRFGATCHHLERGRRIGVSLQINGHSFNPGTICRDNGVEEGFNGWSTTEDAYPDRMGVAVGQTVLVTVKLDPSSDETGGPLPPTGSYQVAIAQDVAFEEYPLPSTPAILDPLNARRDPRALARFTANGPHQATIAWPGSVTVSASSQTPGILRFTVNGRPFPAATTSFWRYDSNLGHHLINVTVPENMIDPPALNAPVTIAVQPQYLTGDWVAQILPPGPLVSIG